MRGILAVVAVDRVEVYNRAARAACPGSGRGGPALGDHVPGGSDERATDQDLTTRNGSANEVVTTCDREAASAQVSGALLTSCSNYGTERSGISVPYRTCTCHPAAPPANTGTNFDGCRLSCATESGKPILPGDGDGVTADVDPVVLNRNGQAATARRCLERAEAATAEAPGPQWAEDGVG